MSRTELVEFEGKRVNLRDLQGLQLAEFVLIFSTVVMGMNDARLLPVGKMFRFTNLLLTAVSLGSLVEYGKRRQELKSSGYKNDEATLVDGVAAEYATAYQLQLNQLTQTFEQERGILNAKLIEASEVINEQDATIRTLKSQNFHAQHQAEADAEQALENLAYEKECIENQKAELLTTEDLLGDRILAFQDEQDQFEQECMARAEQSVQAQFQQYVAQITALQNIIHTLQVPSLIKGSTNEALLGNRVIEAIASMGVILRDVGCVRVCDTYTVWGKPLPTLNGQLIDSLEDTNGLAISSAGATGLIHGKLNSSQIMGALQAQLPGCKNQPTVKINQRSELEFAIDMAPVSHAEQKRQEQFKKAFYIPVQQDARLLGFIKDSLHINLSASTGRGKTTLLDFIVTNLIKIMGSDVEVRYANPKPDRRYKRFNVDFIGVDESINGLFEAAIEIVYRVESNNDVLRQGQPLPEHLRPPFKKFRNRFYLVDEINALVGYFKSWTAKSRANFLDELPGNLDLDDDRLNAFNKYLKPKLGAASMVTDLLKIIWRLGRSENIKLLIAGQNLMPSQMGANVTKADMMFQSMIYSGAKPIEIAFKDDLIDKEFYNECLRTIAAEKAGHASKYWGSFIPMDGTAPPSIIKFPEPITEICGVETYDPDEEILIEAGPGLGLVEDGFSIQAKSIQNKGYRDLEGIELQGIGTSKITPFERVNPAQPSPNSEPSPHEAHKSETFYTVVVGSYLKTGSIAQTIQEIWGLTPSKNRDYQVAKWSVRFILKKCEMPISEKIRPEDRKRDAMNYRQLIDYLEDK